MIGEYAAQIFGNLDGNIDYIEKEFLVQLIGRGDTVTITGEDAAVALTEKALAALVDVVRANGELDDQTMRYCVGMVKSGEEAALSQLGAGCILVTAAGKPIKPKTYGQKKYIEAIEKNNIVFGVGPAGTGKTYLAVVMAVKALKNHEVTRIILTRPAVEAGEHLGFLPGDLQTKIDPYLRPLYDALFDTLGPDGFQKQSERGVIEVAPLAYMRGRTLDNAFVILDEAQNTSPVQMKLFLTRVGAGSRMVVSGDVTQIDLGTRHSGLVDATRILKNIEGITEIRFTEKDVVRFRLVAEIVKAYEKAAKKTGGSKNVK
ncbi:MAG: PhoH family protein [Oscillospiraceae bacterium]|nr:PhoH family protein [Oscillospiraceae bacterium]